MEDIIIFHDVNKSFNKKNVLKNISFFVKRGEVFGYIGPNGSGKSTTLKHIIGFLKPTSGSVIVDGLDAFVDSEKIWNNIGYVSGELNLPNNYTGLNYIKLIYNLRKLNNWDRVVELFKFFDLNPKILIKRMSKGMKQKVAIIIALMHEPEILILDEPTSGLDPIMQKKFEDLLVEEKNKGKTIVLSSHIISEIEKVCDRVAVIKKGEIVLLDELKNVLKPAIKACKVKLKNISDFEKIDFRDFKVVKKNEESFTVELPKNNMNEFLEILKDVAVEEIENIKLDLSDQLKDLYDKAEVKNDK